MMCMFCERLLVALLTEGINEQDLCRKAAKAPKKQQPNLKNQRIVESTNIKALFSLPLRAFASVFFWLANR